MIAHTFQDAFSTQWIKTHLPNRHHDLLILRQLIPWQAIVDGLVPFYNPQKGRHGCDLRTLSAVSILARLRHLSDRQVIESVQENRYMQYFCNVPDRQQFPETLKPLSSSCLFATHYAKLQPHPTRFSSFPIGGFYGNRGAQGPQVSVCRCPVRLHPQGLFQPWRSSLGYARYLPG